MTTQKKHNWVTNLTIVDPHVDEMTRMFLGSCDVFTPEREKELDRLLGIAPTTQEDNSDRCLDFFDEYEHEDEDDNGWIMMEPTLEELMRIEHENVLSEK